MRETRPTDARGLALAIAALTLAAGCDIETLRIQVCTGGVAVLVSTNPEAEFNWSGGCGVGALEVREAGAGGRILWRIQDRQAGNQLVAPIRYGTAPLESTVLIPAAALEPGMLYIVEVTSLQWVQGREIRSVIGGGTFTR
jgi:hypothetical protein